MSKSKPLKKLYYSIGEVAEITGLKPYVLRYWETEFSDLDPSKNRAGNRTYRERDIELVFTIKDLLYNQKYTIDGARQQLAKGKQSGNTDDGTPDMLSIRKSIEQLKHELREILQLLDETE
ncbi:MAG TPA: MerR family transcriptional regulator [bacterium]|nr:MerR family transcriptional regulator [bacterium]